MIPTEEGLVAVKETVKTIGTGDDEIELKRLTPEEKSRRRLVRNLVVGGVCLLVLFATVLLLVWRK